jgi:hypothetical protein
MKVIFHYDAGPRLKARFTSLAAWLTLEMLGRSLEVATENMRRLRDGADLRFRVA